jgi:D-threo-aldose 1-dehydrogenase
MEYHDIGNTGVKIPSIIFGTSCLGNLYKAVPYEIKLESVKEFFAYFKAPVVLDSAGKYGAGLSLETIGSCLRELGIPPESAVISNKLAWYRVPLKGAEPTFEPGVWADLENDAEQKISYDGILKCWEQGNELLGKPYTPSLLSVHDPDEYLNSAKGEDNRKKRLKDVLGAYKALHELKAKGFAKSVGVGSKDWHVIRELSDKVELDWVMLACSLTVMQHPKELLEFIESLRRRNISIVNSAVFHSGFLSGGDFFDYRKTDPATDRNLYEWRSSFNETCAKFAVSPAAACVSFSFTVPGVVSVALNTSNPTRVRENVDFVTVKIPADFWNEMKKKKLISKDYPYL